MIFGRIDPKNGVAALAGEPILEDAQTENFSLSCASALLRGGPLAHVGLLRVTLKGDIFEHPECVFLSVTERGNRGHQGC